jgi:hypothetical protein
MGFLAQALVERSLIESLVAGFDRALLQLDRFVGHGNGKWAAGALALAVLFFVLRPRR